MRRSRWRGRINKIIDPIKDSVKSTDEETVAEIEKSEERSSKIQGILDYGSVKVREKADKINESYSSMDSIIGSIRESIIRLGNFLKLKIDTLTGKGGAITKEAESFVDIGVTKAVKTNMHVLSRESDNKPAVYKIAPDINNSLSPRKKSNSYNKMTKMSTSSSGNKLNGIITIPSGGIKELLSFKVVKNRAHNTKSFTSFLDLELISDDFYKKIHLHGVSEGDNLEYKVSKKLSKVFSKKDGINLGTHSGRVCLFPHLDSNKTTFYFKNGEYKVYSNLEDGIELTNISLEDGETKTIWLIGPSYRSSKVLALNGVNRDLFWIDAIQVKLEKIGYSIKSTVINAISNTSNLNNLGNPRNHYDTVVSVKDTPGETNDAKGYYLQNTPVDSEDFASLLHDMEVREHKGIPTYDVIVNDKEKMVKTSGDKLYLTTMQSLFTSTDNGKTWVEDTQYFKTVRDLARNNDTETESMYKKYGLPGTYPTRAIELEISSNHWYDSYNPPSLKNEWVAKNFGVIDDVTGEHHSAKMTPRIALNDDGMIIAKMENLKGYHFTGEHEQYGDSTKFNEYSKNFYKESYAIINGKSESRLKATDENRKYIAPLTNNDIANINDSDVISKGRHNYLENVLAPLPQVYPEISIDGGSTWISGMTLLWELIRDYSFYLWDNDNNPYLLYDNNTIDRNNRDNYFIYDVIRAKATITKGGNHGMIDFSLTEDVVKFSTHNNKQRSTLDDLGVIIDEKGSKEVFVSIARYKKWINDVDYSAENSGYSPKAILADSHVYSMATLLGSYTNSIVYGDEIHFFNPVNEWSHSSMTASKTVIDLEEHINLPNKNYYKGNSPDKQQLRKLATIRGLLIYNWKKRRWILDDRSNVPYSYIGRFKNKDIDASGESGYALISPNGPMCANYVSGVAIDTNNSIPNMVIGSQKNPSVFGASGEIFIDNNVSKSSHSVRDVTHDKELVLDNNDSDNYPIKTYLEENTTENKMFASILESVNQKSQTSTFNNLFSIFIDDTTVVRLNYSDGYYNRKKTGVYNINTSELGLCYGFDLMTRGLKIEHVNYGCVPFHKYNNLEEIKVYDGIIPIVKNRLNDSLSCIKWIDPDDINGDDNTQIAYCFDPYGGGEFINNNPRVWGESFIGTPYSNQSRGSKYNQKVQGIYFEGEVTKTYDGGRWDVEYGTNNVNPKDIPTRHSVADLTRFAIIGKRVYRYLPWNGKMMLLAAFDGLDMSNYKREIDPNDCPLRDDNENLFPKNFKFPKMAVINQLNFIPIDNTYYFEVLEDGGNKLSIYAFTVENVADANSPFGNVKYNFNTVENMSTLPVNVYDVKHKHPLSVVYREDSTIRLDSDLLFYIYSSKWSINKTTDEVMITNNRKLKIFKPSERIIDPLHNDSKQLVITLADECIVALEDEWRVNYGPLHLEGQDIWEEVTFSDDVPDNERFYRKDLGPLLGVRRLEPCEFESSDKYWEYEIRLAGAEGASFDLIAYKYDIRIKQFTKVLEKRKFLPVGSGTILKERSLGFEYAHEYEEVYDTYDTIRNNLKGWTRLFILSTGQVYNDLEEEVLGFAPFETVSDSGDVVKINDLLLFSPFDDSENLMTFEDTKVDEFLPPLVENPGSLNLGGIQQSKHKNGRFHYLWNNNGKMETSSQRSIHMMVLYTNKGIVEIVPDSINETTYAERDLYKDVWKTNYDYYTNQEFMTEWINGTRNIELLYDNGKFEHRGIDCNNPMYVHPGYGGAVLGQHGFFSDMRKKLHYPMYFVGKHGNEDSYGIYRRDLASPDFIMNRDRTDPLHHIASNAVETNYKLLDKDSAVMPEMDIAGRVYNSLKIENDANTLSNIQLPVRTMINGVSMNTDVNTPFKLPVGDYGKLYDMKVFHLSVATTTTDLWWGDNHEYIKPPRIATSKDFGSEVTGSKFSKNGLDQLMNDDEGVFSIQRNIRSKVIHKGITDANNAANYDVSDVAYDGLGNYAKSDKKGWIKQSRGYGEYSFSRGNDTMYSGFFTVGSDKGLIVSGLTGGYTLYRSPLVGADAKNKTPDTPLTTTPYETVKFDNVDTFKIKTSFNPEVLVLAYRESGAYPSSLKTGSFSIRETPDSLMPMTELDIQNGETKTIYVLGDTYHVDGIRSEWEGHRYISYYIIEVTNNNKVLSMICKEFKTNRYQISSGKDYRDMSYNTTGGYLVENTPNVRDIQGFVNKVFEYVPNTDTKTDSIGWRLIGSSLPVIRIHGCSVRSGADYLEKLTPEDRMPKNVCIIYETSDGMLHRAMFNEKKQNTEERVDGIYISNDTDSDIEIQYDASTPLNSMLKHSDEDIDDKYETQLLLDLGKDENIDDDATISRIVEKVGPNLTNRGSYLKSGVEKNTDKIQAFFKKLDILNISKLSGTITFDNDVYTVEYARKMDGVFYIAGRSISDLKSIRFCIVNREDKINENRDLKFRKYYLDDISEIDLIVFDNNR